MPLSSLSLSTQTDAAFISHHAEWKVKHIAAPLNRGHGLTLSRRETGFINSPGIVRGIYIAIFTRHNYCQSGVCNQGMSRGRQGGCVLATVSGQHL